MTAILNALGTGYSVNQVLKYVSKAFPNLAPAIQRAHIAGYAADQILSFLAQSVDQEENKHLSGPQRQARNQYLQGQLVQKGVAAAATGLGLGMFGGAQSAPQPTLPNPPQPVAAGGGGAPGVLPTAQAAAVPPPAATAPAQIAVGPAPAGPSTPVQNLLKRAMPQVQNISIPQASQPPVNATNITQPTQTIQDQGITNPKEYLEKKGLLQQVNDSLKRGNKPDQVATELGIKRTGKASIDPELLQNIEAYVQEIQSAPQEQKSLEPKSEKLDVPKEAVEVKPESSIVATPNGIGEVKKTRGGESIIDVDGKLHKAKEKEILRPPEDAAVEAMELIKSFTPEEMRSTHHMLNAYDEDEKKGFFVFHNGSAYVVDDISPEEYRELSEEIEQAKTEGETIIGKWSRGEGSRGAGYNKIIKGVRERKVVPELKKPYRRLKVGYNLLKEWQRLLGEYEKRTKREGNQASQ